MAVAKRKEVLAPPGVTNIPVYLKDMQGSRGSEEVGSNDLIIPRLELCQALSPCLKKNDPAYIDGIEEGMLYNNVTREIYGVKESVVICPVMFKKEYLLWRDRKDTGGFYGAYSSFEEAEEKRATLERPEKVEAVDTHQQLCLLVKYVKAFSPENLSTFLTKLGKLIGIMSRVYSTLKSMQIILVHS